MSQLAKLDKMDQGIVLGWSLGRDPETKARAYVARWIPLLPEIKRGDELPVFTTIYQARIRPSSRLAMLSLILAGPVAGLVGLLPEGKYIGLAVVAIGLTLGTMWWRRSPSIWERGAFVRLLGEGQEFTYAESPAPPEAEDIPSQAATPLVDPAALPIVPSVIPLSAPPFTSPPAAPIFVVPQVAVTTQEALPAVMEAAPAVPRSPVSHTPDWSTAQPAPALKTPPWAPADIPLPAATNPTSGGDGDAALPAWPAGSRHPMAGTFDTLLGGTGDTRPPIEPAPGVPALQGELSVDVGPDAGRTFKAGDAPIKVGRAPDNDVVLVDPRTSRHHAQIELRGYEFWIVDLASANGTMVNGDRVGERPLNHGDLVHIGQNKMSFRLVKPELSLI